MTGSVDQPAVETIQYGVQPGWLNARVVITCRAYLYRVKVVTWVCHESMPRCPHGEVGDPEAAGDFV